MYGPRAKAPTDELVCGREIPAHSVGQQGAPLECRNKDFELFPGPPDASKKVTFKTHCVSCHAQDPMTVIYTGIGAQWTLGPHGHLMCPCGNARFRLLDKGNEVFTTCTHCSGRQQLGFTAGATGR